MNGMVECQDCYFSELIDSTLYCHHNCEDVSFKQYCTDFVNYNMFVVLPRQFGKTIGAVSRYLWVYNFGTTNSEIMFMHLDHSRAKGNLKTLKTFRDILPSYLRMDSNVNAEGKKLKVPNTVVTIQNPFNNNRIVFFHE